MLALFHEHYKVHYAPRGLMAWVIYVVCLLIVLIIPFIVGLAMQNFWVENNYFYYAPNVTFTGRAVLRVSTVLGKEYLWTTSDSFNDRYVAGSTMDVLPFFSIYAEEVVKGEKSQAAAYTLTVSVPVNSPDVTYRSDDGSYVALTQNEPLDAIKEMQLLPEFAYYIRSSIVTLNMTAAPLLTYRRAPGTYSSSATDNTSAAYSSGPVCGLLEADLVFHTTEPLISSPYVRYTDTYTDSPLETKMRQPADVYKLDTFSHYYSSRNQSVVLRPYVEVDGGLDLLPQEEVTRGLWEDLDTLNAFTWRIQLRVADAFVPYVPSYREVLKWAWVQYFVIAYVIQWLLWKLRGMIVTQGLIDTTAVYFARKLD
ncbi:hypothetical protein STCU_04015 [Strigomonas culicis]|uniref:Transmembrane protein 231 n=1 Tax=Strigomonas culicis TaxID=28005 RepID=S9VTQ0_9TRYP|nr:hypothetical protein STCU_04015 [Strigomonas culicis]|eukprot:EPY30541.1 hypothetical protein STCU_04015 [Strigomonas culicis]